ncbi:GGDEF domain-containing protein [Mangrovibrevibacter kandeliae]|uniref:GGDEF domain-containing protein n=1 Tax=Mangrovibrevibacter kandeliae TaxID=2968473 RepID=UPI002117C5DD|nr:diguanylate cyclase [Aurantimonas sp. CSK15Z-1]
MNDSSPPHLGESARLNGAGPSDRIDDPADELGLKARMRGTVAVTAAEDRAGELFSIVASLGYQPIDGRTAGTGDKVVASLIQAACDPHLELTRSQSKHAYVVLLDLPNTFEQRLAAARAGAHGVISGEFSPNELGAWLSECDKLSQQRPSYTILIVDDDDLAGEFYAAALEAAGMHTHLVTSASQVLAAVETQRPDLVLMDMHMPDASGLEVAQLIRQSRAALAMPIIFLSAERDRQVRFNARAVGGDDFITKPIDPDELAAVVRLRAERAVTLRRLMERDSLTDLLNHASFKARLAEEMERSRRTGAPLTVCILDIDHFKAINDTWGHQVGDYVIQALARALRRSLRQNDVVSRYGGEEFAILLLDTGIDHAEVVIDRIRSQFSEIPMLAGDTRFTVSFSAGVASNRADLDTVSIINEADVALYQAKRGGRNRVATARRA